MKTSKRAQEGEYFLENSLNVMIQDRLQLVEKSLLTYSNFRISPRTTRFNDFHISRMRANAGIRMSELFDQNQTPVDLHIFHDSSSVTVFF